MLTSFKVFYRRTSRGPRGPENEERHETQVSVHEDDEGETLSEAAVRRVRNIERTKGHEIEVLGVEEVEEDLGGEALGAA